MHKKLLPLILVFLSPLAVAAQTAAVAPAKAADGPAKTHVAISTDPNLPAAIHVTPAGRVGIGTNAPRSALDVIGDLHVSEMLLAHRVFAQGVTLYENAGGAIEIGDSRLRRCTPFIDFHYGVGVKEPSANVRLINQHHRTLTLDIPGSTTPIGGLSIVVGSFGSASNQVASNFLEARDGSGKATAFLIRGDGRVGIGTDKPVATLDVRGDVRVNNAISWAPGSPAVVLKAPYHDADLGMAYLRGTEHGSLELGDTEAIFEVAEVRPYLDFKFSKGKGVKQDYNVRLQNDLDGVLNLFGEFRTSGPIQAQKGANLAEMFTVRGATNEVQPGAVVSVDPEGAARLRLSRQAYDPLVAGVIAGANGLPSGFVLDRREGTNGTPHLLALAGRTWVLAEAGPGAIKPGDMLTSSDTPGHAMRVSDRDRAFGAVLGKALTALPKGRGFVLLLVQPR